MKGGKAGRPRRGTAGSAAKKNTRGGARKGAVNRRGAAPKTGGKAPREFGAFRTRDDDR